MTATNPAQPEAPAQPAAQSRPTRPHQEPTLSGALGQVLVAGVVAAVVGGIIFGLARPGQAAQMVGDGAYTITGDVEAGFKGFLIATVLSAVAGLALGALAWARHARCRGVVLLTGTGAIAAVTALGIVTVGDIIGMTRQGDAATAAAGDVVTLIPPVDALVPALLAALLAMLVHWAGVFIAGIPGDAG